MEQRSGDLVLPQGTYVLLQDGASGQVEVVTGPHKVSLADTEKPVIYERESRRYTPTPPANAIKVCPAADEGQYIVLTNPSQDTSGKQHPAKGKQTTIPLSFGRRINIQGPETFSLYPGQIADVIDGHQLKSNEYLVIRVYNEKEAKANLDNAIVKTAEGGEGEKKDKKVVSKNLFDDKEIRTGNLLIIKGTDVSFYIPPTGIEVLEENGNYTRKAVTLERLEYCILLDQNGDKRYVKGPDVVFPKPTETFIENKGKAVFRAIELNENMGLYIKVIADYEDTGKKYSAGEELFITGKEQKIYFPRAEHAIIKYGNEVVHYATAVPAGEGRYILNKNTGDIELVKGPKMLLPDPRNEVIVKRVLDPKTVELWFPGNSEAKNYNEELSAALDYNDEEYLESNFSKGLASNRMKETVYSSMVGDMIGDEMKRKTNYTKPRTIQLNTKYEGAVLLNIWPNYAVQVVNKEGKRRVVEGPSVVMLEYDETLEVLELSTGTPKNDDNIVKTVYLQTKNNLVSDVVNVVTKDLVEAKVKLSYKINFEEDSSQWFNVANYIKLITQHMRSLIRNAVKKVDIEKLNDEVADIIRDTILGESKEGKRSGRIFEENGARIYDVEVLALKIEDDNISYLLQENQHDTVRRNLELLSKGKELEFTKKSQKYTREELDEQIITSEKQKEVSLKTAANKKEVDEAYLNNKLELEEKTLASREEQQERLNKINEAEVARKKALDEQETLTLKERAEINTEAIKSEMAAITPGLIEALVVNGNVRFAETLAKNLKSSKDGLSSIFGSKGGFAEIIDAVKGSPLESKVNDIMKAYENLKKNK